MRQETTPVLWTINSYQYLSWMLCAPPQYYLSLFYFYRYSVILCSYSCSLTQNYIILQTAQVTSWCLSHDILYSTIELLNSSFYILLVFIFLIIATQSDVSAFLSSWKRSITCWCGIGHANSLRWILISMLNFPPRHNKPHTRSPDAPNYPTGNKSCRQIYNLCSSNENMQNKCSIWNSRAHVCYRTSHQNIDCLYVYVCLSVCVCGHPSWDLTKSDSTVYTEHIYIASINDQCNYR